MIWAARVIQQVFNSDQFDAVWLQDRGGVPFLDATPIYFFGLVNNYDLDDDGELQIASQDLTPLRVGCDELPLMDCFTNFVGVIPRGDSPLCHVDAFDLPHEIVEQLTASRGNSAK